MKRADQLAPLSREHHQGLVVAQHAIQLRADAELALIQEKWHNLKQHLHDIEEHFQIEERYILEPLREFEECEDMVAQIYSEHQYLRDFAVQPVGGDLDILQAVGNLLKSHIKYEEKTVFPTAQELLSEFQLNAALAAHPESRV